MSVNNMASVCGANCSFEWSAEATPVVESVDASDLAAVQLHGSGFDALQPMNNRVLIGEVLCKVTEATERLIVCQAGQNPVGTYGFRVVVAGKGLAEMRSNTMVNFGLSVDGFSPQSGSSGGGNVVRVTGTGFSEETRVEMDGRECVVVRVDYGWVECVAPANVS